MLAEKSKPDINVKISAFLKELADFEKNVAVCMRMLCGVTGSMLLLQRNINKSNIYRKAARSIGELDHPVRCGDEAKKLVRIVISTITGTKSCSRCCSPASGRRSPRRSTSFSPRDT